MKYLSARVNEIFQKVKKYGLRWALRRLFCKINESLNKNFNELRQFLNDIKKSGLRYALENYHVQAKFNSLLKESYRYSTLRKKAPNPVHAHIEVTSFCNLNCSMCPQATLKRSKGTMDLEHFQKIINEFASYRLPNTLFLHFSGEPLLNQDLPKMIAYAKQKGVPWIKFNTNALLLNEKKSREILNSGLDCMVCAVEMSREQQNLLRPGADYEKVVENVKRFMQLKKSMKIKKPLVKLQMLATKTNRHLKKKAYRQWKNIVDRVDFHPMHTVGGLVEDLGAIKSIRSHCEQVWVSLVLLWNGDVVPCCLDHNASLKVGNIFDSSLKEIWNHRSLELLRLDDRKGKFRNPICKKCMMQGINY